MFKRKRILVVGDVMLDRYLIGQVDRISPEAPVPVLNLRSTDERPGGAANVALNLKNLGMEVAICSITGDDRSAKILQDLLIRADIQHLFISKSVDRPTTVKSRIMAKSQHLLRVDEETDAPLNEEEAVQFLANFNRSVDQFKPEAIILQDYNKGLLTPFTIQHMLEVSAAKHIPVAVDPKFEHFDAYKNIYLFKPNLQEASQATGVSFKNLSGTPLKAAAMNLRNHLQCKYLLMTMSADGILMADEHQVSTFPAQPRSIADVCGAGDTVISTAMAAMLSNFSPNEAAEISNLAGGMVCEYPGVVPIQCDALQQEWNKLKESSRV